MTRLLAQIADSGPVVVLAGIAAAGSFTHIHDTAAEHGQHGWMSWAVAVCIDLTCVMAARERQRDKKTGRATGRLSWPTVVLVGAVLLSLAANLAQAEPSVWGWVVAATPAAAFLVAVSMLERRASSSSPKEAPVRMTVPPSWGQLVRDEPSSPVPDVPEAVPALDAPEDEANERPSEPDTALMEATAPRALSRELLDFALRVAREHEERTGKPITRDVLRGRLSVSNQLASDLLRQIKSHS